MLSTRQAAKRLGLGVKTLSHYIAVGKVPPPTILEVGSASLHAWTEADIERVRKLLPKIKNGRKTRYQKREQAIGNRPQGKTRKKKQKREQATGNRPQSEKAKSESRAKEPQPRAHQPRPAQKQRQRTSGAPAAVPHKKKQK